LIRVLTNSFTPLQADRYEKWNRTRLRKETLRRIVNHALSQSVPQSVVTVINGFTKVFIGELIEKARTVQEEWAEAFDSVARETWEREQAEIEAAAAAKVEAENKVKAEAEAEKTESKPKSESKEEDRQPNGTTTTTTTTRDSQSATPSRDIPAMLSPAKAPADHQSPYASTTSTGQQVNGISTSAAVPRREFVPPVNPHRAQLLPDHIREALRRYRRNGEGGGTGMSGLSQPNVGVRGAFTWQIGPTRQRLFR
jgi:transcription initiation factor TFIID subunit 11